MAFDWLFGPKYTRTYRLDLDTVRELGEAVKTAYPAMVVRYYVRSPGVEREVAADKLGDLSPADLNRLTLDARLTMPEGQAYFGPIVSIGLSRASSWMQASAPPAADGSSTSDMVLTDRLMQILSDSSRPLIHWRKFRPLTVLAWVPFVALLTGWLWLELTTPLVIPVHLIGWAVVVLALLVTRPLYQRAKSPRTMNERQPQYGHIVLSETRRETAARRGDHRRDVRVALYSIGGTILAGLVVAVILYFTLGIGAPAPIPTP